MPTYPSDIQAVRDAILTFAPPPSAAEAVGAALGYPSPVSQIVTVFNALKGEIETLDVAGLNVLAGCAHLISENAWFGLGGEAFSVRDAAVAAIAAA